MLKHCLLVVQFLLIIPCQIYSQNEGISVVSVPGYFDISPPLGAMNLSLIKKSDQSWKEGAVKNCFNIPRQSETTGDVSDSTTQLLSGPKTGDTVLLNFHGMGNLSNVVPPDPCGDAGPDYYFQMVNVSCAIYDKTGSCILGPFNSSGLWNGMPHNSNNGDGIVLYDENADRWFISQLSLPNYPDGPFYQMIAVSQTDDPTGSWFRWEYAFTDLPDYPKFGIWPDGYYMSCNRISASTVYVGTGSVVFDRTAMLNGDPYARMLMFQKSSGDEAYFVLPADCDGDFPFPGTPEYFLFMKRNYIGVREFHTDWSHPENSTFGNLVQIPVSPFGNFTDGIPQKGTSAKLMALNDLLMFRLQFRKFGDHQSMVTNHTVGVGATTGIRWYELRRTTDNWFLHQQSTYSPDTSFRWMGSIAMDESGNIALGYSVSGQNLFPSVRYCGRMANDPPGQMTIAEREIISGGGSQTGDWGGRGRWGDYSAMSVDPSASNTFWYTQEYFDSTSWNGWKTRIASFSFANILTMRVTSESPEICRGNGCKLHIELSGGTGNYTYFWSSVPAGFNSFEKDPLVFPDFPTKYIATVSDGQSVCTDTIRLSILEPPEVFSGYDSICCNYVDEIALEGRASDVIFVNWTTSGDGTFSDENNLITKYLPGIFDKRNSSVTLKLHGIPQPPCEPVSSEKQITFKPCPGIDESSVSCLRMDVFPNPTYGQFSVRIQIFSPSPLWLRIINQIGEDVYGSFFPSSTLPPIFKIDLSEYSTGVYTLEAKTEETVIYKKIILQK